MDKPEDESKPDPLTQLVTTFCRGAMTERSGALQEDALFMSYAQIISKSCGEEEEEGEGEEGGGSEEEGAASIHVSLNSLLSLLFPKPTVSVFYFHCYSFFYVQRNNARVNPLFIFSLSVFLTNRPAVYT